MARGGERYHHRQPTASGPRIDRRNPETSARVSLLRHRGTDHGRDCVGIARARGPEPCDLYGTDRRAAHVSSLRIRLVARAPTIVRGGACTRWPLPTATTTDIPRLLHRCGGGPCSVRKYRLRMKRWRYCGHTRRQTVRKPRN